MTWNNKLGGKNEVESEFKIIIKYILHALSLLQSFKTKWRYFNKYDGRVRGRGLLKFRYAYGIKDSRAYSFKSSNGGENSSLVLYKVR